jgi:hypothetical protein
MAHDPCWCSGPFEHDEPADRPIGLDREHEAGADGCHSIAGRIARGASVYDGVPSVIDQRAYRLNVAGEPWNDPRHPDNLD